MLIYCSWFVCHIINVNNFVNLSLVFCEKNDYLSNVKWLNGNWGF